MPDQPKRDGVFISCVSDEFERDGAAYPGLRGQLRGYLARARINVRVQEDFPQTAVDTVRKLADEIRPRAVVIQLVGEKPGAIAAPAAVAEYLARGRRLPPGLQHDVFRSVRRTMSTSHHAYCVH